MTFNTIVKSFIANDGYYFSATQADELLDKVKAYKATDDEKAIIARIRRNLNQVIKEGSMVLDMSDFKKEVAAFRKSGLGRKPADKKEDWTGKKSDVKPVPGGRVAEHYRKQGGVELVLKKSLVESKRLPKQLRDNLSSEDFIKKYFGIHHLEFGNWLSQTDRYNYLASAAIGLFDIKEICGFAGDNIGLRGKLELAFGARGKGGRASGTFEPSTFAINLVRYSRKEAAITRVLDKPKSASMNTGGGSHALAHEYGHALDYYFGTFVTPQPSHSISGGMRGIGKINRYVIETGGPHGLMEALMEKIAFNAKGESSAYMNRLMALFADKIKPGTTNYWLRRNELFARAFEVYIAFKLKKMGLTNPYLSSTKYDKRVYLTHNELRALEPDFDKLIVAMRRGFKSTATHREKTK